MNPRRQVTPKGRRLLAAALVAIALVGSVGVLVPSGAHAPPSFVRSATLSAGVATLPLHHGAPSPDAVSPRPTPLGTPTVNATDAPTLSIGSSPTRVCRSDDSGCTISARVTKVTLEIAGPTAATRSGVPGRPMVLFVPFPGMEVAAPLLGGPDWQAHCVVANGTGTIDSCPADPQVLPAGGESVYGWNWSTNSSRDAFLAGSDWTISFDLAAGPGLTAGDGFPVDACTTFACQTAGSAPVGGRYASASYLVNGTAEVESFPLAMLKVLAPAALNVTALASGTTGVAPFTTTFGAGASGGELPYTYAWYFGDGTAPVHGANATHTYTIAGNYSATILAVDGWKETAQRILRLVVTAPAAPLSATFTARYVLPLQCSSASYAVNFTAELQGGTAPYRYLWLFGDGTTSNAGPKVTHTFTANASSRTVQLQVNDATGDTVTASQQLPPPAEPCTSSNPSGPGTSPFWTEPWFWGFAFAASVSGTVLGSVTARRYNRYRRSRR